MSSSNLWRKEDSSLIDFIDSVSPIYIDGHSQVSPRPRRYICHHVARIPANHGGGLGGGGGAVISSKGGGNEQRRGRVWPRSLSRHEILYLVPWPPSASAR